jgi:hypothetical protein
VSRLFANPVSIYLAIVGTLSLASSLVLLIARVRLSAGERTTGQIAGYRERMRGRAGEKRQYMPLVRYQPRIGQIVEFQSRMGTSSKPYQIGEPVPVIYRPDKPAAAEIDTSARLWLAPAALAAIGLVTLYGAWKAGAPH